MASPVARAVPYLRHSASVALLLCGLLLAACGSGGGGGSSAGSGSGNGSNGGSTDTFQTGMAASVALGQADLNSAVGNNVSATGLHGPTGVSMAAGVVWVADGNSRIMGWDALPTGSGQAADFVLGQGGDFTTNTQGATATTFTLPSAAVSDGSHLAIVDYYNNRVLIWFVIPTSDIAPSLVLGQTDTTSTGAACAGTGLSKPYGVALAWPKVAVADDLNQRVLLWNDVSNASNGAAADVVLGQANATSCNSNRGGSTGAGTVAYPSGVWTDGTRVAVADSGNNRVLIWNAWPTSNGQSADLVVGQSGMTSGASGVGATHMSQPDTVTSDGTRLVVADTANNRVLIFNSFPTANGAAANVVLGQPNFSSVASGTSATTLNMPVGVNFDGTHLLVADSSNNRVLVFP